MKVYKVGFIGYGGMAGYHASTIRDCYDRMEVKGVFDIDSRRLKVAEEQGYKAYSSKEELLSDPEIDVVIVATTNEVHKELSIEALRAGKHVICEKPVTMSSAELLEIMEVAKECDALFTIDQNRRTNRDFVLARRYIEDGTIGKPYLIESRVEGSRGMPGGWRAIKRLGGGMLYDWGVHLLDQILYMIEEKVVSVYCKMFSIHYPEIDDSFRLTLTFESGLVAQVEVSTNNFITHPRWYVLGTEGTFQINNWDCDGQLVRLIDKENEWAEDIVYTKAGPTKTMAPRSEESTETIELTEPADAVPFDLPVVYEQLINAIEGKAELTITAEQALRVLRVMEAAFESAETDEVVKTNL